VTKDRLKWIISGFDLDLLSAWEKAFIDTIEWHFERKGDLSEKQEEILERLYREKGR
jgi:hypothetical protein